MTNEIKAARMAAGLSQQKMSDLLKVPKKTIEKWETGTRKPPCYVTSLVIEKLVQIAEMKGDTAAPAGTDVLAREGAVPRSQFAELAQRIAGLRDACGYDVEEFADLLGVDREAYRAYEQTGFDVPASLLMHIANVCKVDMGVLLTGVSTHLNSYQVVRAGQGRVVDRFPGYHFQDLAYNYQNKVMQPLLVTLDPSDEPAGLVTHAGQEFNYVIQGTVILVFADRELVLNVGDCVYFNPHTPHGQRCGSKIPAVFVTMITE
jgi:transcriptional regulator with XRE-family HTH domain